EVIDDVLVLAGWRWPEVVEHANPRLVHTEHAVADAVELRRPGDPFALVDDAGRCPPRARRYDYEHAVDVGQDRFNRLDDEVFSVEDAIDSGALHAPPRRMSAWYASAQASLSGRARLKTCRTRAQLAGA